jgi:hypothetical protein
MSATPPVPPGRPRIVDVAFWCWLAAAVFTAALGLFLASQNIPTFYRAAGVLLVVVGLAHGFLAGRARKHQSRFASAGVALAMAAVAFLAVLLLFGAVGVATAIAIMALMITGSILMQRKSAQEWFEAAQ